MSVSVSVCACMCMLVRIGIYVSARQGSSYVTWVICRCLMPFLDAGP